MFQAFEMMPNPHVSNVLELVAPAVPLTSAELGPGAAPLDPDSLPELVDAATARWTEAGLSTEDQAALQDVQVSVSDLPDGVLGTLVGDTVLLDRDAAGHGWFVDPTPEDDAEFAAGAVDFQLEARDGAAASRIDALTVVMHELGHVMGHPDLMAPGHLMYHELNVGSRRLPTNYTNWRLPADVDADGIVTPSDVLLVINVLNVFQPSGDGKWPEIHVATGGAPTMYLDTDRDLHLTPMDALYVINYLSHATKSVSVAEAEAVAGKAELRLPTVPQTTDAALTVRERSAPDNSTDHPETEIFIFEASTNECLADPNPIAGTHQNETEELDLLIDDLALDVALGWLGEG
jgi:hypothetical protein